MYLNDDVIDFERYLQETDHKTRVKKAVIWSDELEDEVLHPRVDTSTVMPWSSTAGSFAFRPGEVTVWAGLNGSGKSMLTGQVALSLIKQEQRVCIASFEMKPKVSLKRLIRQFSGIPIDAVGPLPASVATRIEAIRRFKVFSEKHLWFYDQQGTAKAEIIIAMCRFCAEELQMNHIFIDNLMKVVKGEDDYNAQKDFVDQITGVARDYNMHIHLVHHIRKLASDEARPSKSDLRGSSSITDQVDNVLILWRNKKKEHEIQRGDLSNAHVADAILMCEKQRNGEHEDWFDLWFNRTSYQFLERDNGAPMAFDLKGDF
jgi:twinkle protein